ncbi:CoA transferase [Myxococcota bacterium]|nr:CoA transferase [Myxococcota bacterium]
MSMPLEGLRVIDWTIWQQGPAASQMLADLGAEVIKIESPDGGDPGRGVMSMAGLDMTQVPNAYFEGNNRNKKSITLDLKKPEAQEVVYRLIARSDIFVQNFRKGVADRLGLGYEDLRAHNDKLIYASATGYGPEGPDSGDPSFDLLGQARSGIMMAAGEPDMPPLTLAGGPADQMGAVMLAYGVLAAVVARERLGVGQKVDGSHLGSMMWLQALSVSARLMVGGGHPRSQRSKPGNPLWNHYRCGDDQWLVMGMIQADRYWGDFCRAIGRPEMIEDERFATMQVRGQNSEACVAILDEVFASKPRAEWLEILRKGGDFIFTLVNSVNDLPDDPQVKANGYVVPFDHPRFGPVQVQGMPVTLHETPGQVRLPAPELGEHTEQVLTELLDYSWEEVAELRERKVT